jgi:hypothetical protein
VLLRGIEQERKVKETEELEQRSEELERRTESGHQRQLRRLEEDFRDWGLNLDKVRHAWERIT